MALIVVICLVPGFAHFPLRILAAMVAMTCIWYFVYEVVDLVRNGEQRIRIGEPSAVMAGIAMIVFGIPALALAVGGEWVTWVKPVRMGLDRDDGEGPPGGDDSKGEGIKE